jgi:protocatechuate 3,4-dioxygenase beta subunit
MSVDEEGGLTRRQALAASASSTVALVVIACGGDDGADDGTGGAATVASEPGLKPTPACGEGEHTPEQTEGPFFTPDSPQRTDLMDAGVAGTPLVLAGRVLGTDCRPLTGALLDFWQADGDGVYDNSGFSLRGHQFSGRDGRFWLNTVVPGLYPGRTRHIHVKAQPRGGEVLTTQLYFPGEAANDADPLFDPAPLIAAEDGGDLEGSFDFVLPA